MVFRGNEFAIYFDLKGLSLCVMLSELELRVQEWLQRMVG